MVTIIDGRCRIYARFKYVANGIACFEQFGTNTLLRYPMATYGKSWRIDNDNDDEFWEVSNEQRASVE